MFREKFENALIDVLKAKYLYVQLNDQFFTNLWYDVYEVISTTIVSCSYENLISTEAMTWLTNVYISKCIKIGSKAYESEDVIRDHTENKKNDVQLTIIEKEFFRKEFKNTVIEKELDVQ